MKRTFKHKKFGWIATKSETEEYIISFIVNGEEDEVEIPVAIIRESKDWEEVVEKDFEVLLYKNPNGQPHTNYKNNLITCEENGCLLYSVKHIPSGKIWSLGDKCYSKEVNIASGKINQCTIDKFEIKNDGKMRVYFKGIRNWDNLSELTEPKEEVSYKEFNEKLSKSISETNSARFTVSFTISYSNCQNNT